MDFFTRINSHRPYAYYALPMLVGLLVTFILIRIFVATFPDLVLKINGTHVHHFLPGMLILGIMGYFGFWIKRQQVKYFLAMGYGSGMGFILDEFYFMLRLDASPINYQQYGALVIGASILLALAILPGSIHGFWKLLEGED